MKNTYFITGISTDVGKTIVSAVITEMLQADYWKPIQAGDLENSDTMKVQRLVSNSKSVFHQSAYALKTPASPHFSAQLDDIQIVTSKIIRPKTENNLVIEGAGGLYVPVNQTDTIADLILPTDNVIVVSRHYLGSINHTLLTCEALKHLKMNVLGIIFSGNENPSTESIILEKTNLKILGRLADEPYFDANVIRYYAEKWSEKFENFSQK